jgi:2-polyprenyl-6-methoxyphenol hydroxylase-like FAD-dependent oxidoreductase
MNHAIVMGGSIAGLAAAAALSSRFTRVTLLERDEDSGAKPHRGAPQVNHPHVLLARGRRALEGLMPGLFESMAADGAKSIDFSRDAKWFTHGNWKISTPSDLMVSMQSRPLLDEHVRRRVRALGNVELRFGVGVDEPIHERPNGSHRPGRVCGVRLRDGTELRADLVIDATGRGSRSAVWLEGWGYGEVPEQQLEIGLAYVTGEFELAPGVQVPSTFVGINQVPPSDSNALVNKRGGYIVETEKGRSLVTLFGYHGDHAPTDIDGFRAWSSTLAQSAIHDALDGARLVGPLRRFGFPRQVRRRFETLPSLPSGYLVMGDAACNFDPTFGQGMSVAAVQAELLGNLIGKRSTARIQRRLARVANIPWDMTCAEAHRWAETRGPDPIGGSFQRRYVGRLFELCGKYQDVYGAMTRVIQLEASPTSLFGPLLLRRALFG